MSAVGRFFEANGHRVQVPYFDVIHVDHFHYSISEVMRMCAVARSIPHNAILNFLFWQGPRVGEICNIKTTDVDMVHEEVKIFGQKNHKWRTIPLQPEVLPSLKAWMDMREKSSVPILQEQGLPVPAYLFLNQDGKMFCKDSIQGVVERAGRRAGFVGDALKESHPHTLRHSIGHYLLHERGWDIATVAYYLGDTIATIEKYYAHTGIDDVRRNMNRRR